MRDIVEQIYDELNAQVIRMLEHARKQAERIAELERENSSLAYELNVALSSGIISCPEASVHQEGNYSTQVANKRDAERYRLFTFGPYPICFLGRDFYSKYELDTAIDTAQGDIQGDGNDT